METEVLGINIITESFAFCRIFCFLFQKQRCTANPNDNNKIHNLLHYMTPAAAAAAPYTHRTVCCDGMGCNKFEFFAHTFHSFHPSYIIIQSDRLDNYIHSHEIYFNNSLKRNTECTDTFCFAAAAAGIISQARQLQKGTRVSVGRYNLQCFRFTFHFHETFRP